MTDTNPTTIFLTNTPVSAAVQIYQCQKQWDELRSSARADVRFCDHCHHAVHQVVDVDGFVRSVSQGQCVMVAGFDHADKSQKLFVGQPGAASFEMYALLPVQDN
jgi:hypothetical protein